VLKLEINYRVIIYQRILYLEGWWFLLEDFWKIMFLYGEVFEFSRFLFWLKILFNVH
jgi:hypothetical protein